MPAEAVLPGAATGLLAFAARLRAPAVRVYPPGAYLIRQGDPATEMLILRRGTCNVLVQDGPHLPLRTVATRQPPDFVGEMGILMDRTGKIVVPGLSGHIETQGVGATPVDTALHDLKLHEHDADDDDPVVGRRTASVVAVTEVEAAVLRAREVRWALSHDETVRHEILTAVEQRQRELLSRR
jgi:CRP-like cAMP-binding protein